MKRLLTLLFLLIPLITSGQDNQFSTPEGNKFLTEITQSVQGYISASAKDKDGNQIIVIQPPQMHNFESMRIMINLMIDIQGVSVKRPWTRDAENYLSLVKLRSSYIGLVYNTEDRVLALIEILED